MTPETHEHEHDDDCTGCDLCHDHGDAQRADDEASYAAHVSGPACGWRL